MRTNGGESNKNRTNELTARLSTRQEQNEKQTKNGTSSMAAVCLTSMNLFRSCLVARRCRCLLFSFIHSVLSIFVSRFVYWRRHVIVVCCTLLMWPMVSRWARTRCDPSIQFSLLIFIFFGFLLLFSRLFPCFRVWVPNEIFFVCYKIR